MLLSGCIAYHLPFAGNISANADGSKGKQDLNLTELATPSQAPSKLDSCEQISSKDGQ